MTACLSCRERQNSEFRIQALLEMITEKLSRYLDGPLRDSQWAGDAMLLCQKNYRG